MSWLSKHLDPSAAHLTYLILALFLILYASFSQFIRNRIHLSEPPLATLFGIIFGPRGFDVINPTRWGFEDNVTQEATRLIVGLQVFSVGISLPRDYFSKHHRSCAILLGPIMAFSWLITAALIYGILQTKWTTALIISACLAPTDPVLAASVLAESTFSVRVPKRLKNLLSAESGINDGVSFPFLYLGILSLIKESNGVAVKEWILGTLLWQCALGIIMGLILGFMANKAVRLVEKLSYIDSAATLSFYILLAVMSIGIASSLGIDDFLVAFGSGYAFAWNGWFREKMQATNLPEVLDLLLNSSMFVYFGAQIPWNHMNIYSLSPPRLIALVLLIILLRRIPIMIALKPLIPDLHTYREALFCGHFGPMGLGALFLVIEARAELETGTSLPDGQPPNHGKYKEEIEIIWPVVCSVVLGSTMIHGLSACAISVVSHFTRHKKDRAALPGQERDPLVGMYHDDESDEEVGEDRRERRNEIED